MLNQDPKIALLSIHPEYVNAILEGRKRYEFRRTAFASIVSHVVMYSTAPDKAILGYFEVANIYNTKPLDLWINFREFAGIEEGPFFEYFKGCRSGIAIEVGKVCKLPEPVPLIHLDIRTPPQSFRYITSGAFDYLRRGVLVMLDTTDYTFTYEYSIDEPAPEPAATPPESTRSMHMFIARQIADTLPILQDVSDDLSDRLALLIAIEGLLDAEMAIDEIESKIDQWVQWAIGKGYPLAELPIALSRLLGDRLRKSNAIVLF